MTARRYVQIEPDKEGAQDERSYAPKSGFLDPRRRSRLIHPAWPNAMTTHLIPVSFLGWN